MYFQYAFSQTYPVTMDDDAREVLKDGQGARTCWWLN